jgi:hypothetical protein
MVYTFSKLKNHELCAQPIFIITYMLPHIENSNLFYLINTSSKNGENRWIHSYNSLGWNI